MMEFLKDMFRFLKQRKKWWLVPMIVILVLFAALLILGSSSALAPYIYSLFWHEIIKGKSIFNSNRRWFFHYRAAEPAILFPYPGNNCCCQLSYSSIEKINSRGMDEIEWTVGLDFATSHPFCVIFPCSNAACHTEALIWQGYAANKSCKKEQYLHTEKSWLWTRRYGKYVVIPDDTLAVNISFRAHSNCVNKCFSSLCCPKLIKAAPGKRQPV